MPTVRHDSQSAGPFRCAHRYFVDVEVGQLLPLNRLPQAAQRSLINLERMDSSALTDKVQRKHAVITDVGADIQKGSPWL